MEEEAGSILLRSLLSYKGSLLVCRLVLCVKQLWGERGTLALLLPYGEGGH